MRGRLTRRRVLHQLGSVGVVGTIAGCQGPSPISPDSTERPPDSSTSTSGQTGTDDHPQTGNQETETPLNVLHVDGQRGSPSGRGTDAEPIKTVQTAIDRARPGQTVTVASGEYRLRQPLRTVRDGTADAPITLTGPPDAVIRPTSDIDRMPSLFRIRHNHIHLRGLTLTGLGDASRPETIEQYKVRAVIRVMPPTDSSAYLRDIVVKPDRVGHSYWGTINHKRANNVEIGAFEVIGPAGAGYVLTGEPNKHAGEIVYLGTPPSAVLENVVPQWGIDESHGIYVHHIDNSAGYPHSELVNTKLGTYDVRIEYCTDGGGSQNTESYPPASIHLQSYDATVRWCALHDGDGHGVHINAGSAGALTKLDDPPVAIETIGTNHSIYHNRITGFGVDALSYQDTSPAEQLVVCENTVDEPSGPETTGCPADVPTGNGRGHRGGDTPWKSG